MSSKSTNRTNCARSSSAQSKHSARVVGQTPIDAKLNVDFEEIGRQFDYSTSVDLNISTSTSNVPSSTISAYLQMMQRGRLIQPFGCVLAVDEQNLRVLAYSENAHEMLDLAPHAVPNIEQQEALTFGTDVRTLFRSSGAAALQKAANFGEVNLLNPILVHCKTSGKPFYAILHRIDVGLVIDLEPVNPADVPVTAAGPLKSYKLAAKAISRLQSLMSGSISVLCDVLVKEVSELTGYDRVMVYKFHEDEHGEVVAEARRPDLDPYLGLHYPATDIPQASRFLFIKNKVRMICDALAPPVQVVQDRRLAQPISLCGSALRSAHGCHAQYMVNMGSIASLVMSVTINDGDDEEAVGVHPKGRKLWGLVVCHHNGPRFVPFPLRYACEFLIQVFGVQINKEVELAAELRGKHILRTQTVLCDMLLRDTPVGIVTQSPNVTDLVKCDGAALYYQNKLWLLGITPTETQIRDIAKWLLEYHSESTGLSTDSLMEAGYPGALILGEAVCGMAAIRTGLRNFLFWFRSHTAKEIEWGGAKHEPGDRDDGRRMHPRSSFKAFLEVAKQRSLPWEDVEMDAIHSLQIIMRGSVPEVTAAGDSKATVEITPSAENKIIDGNRMSDELRIVANEMVRLIETAAVPVLAVDSSGNVNGWNVKAADVTGLSVEDAMGVPLVDLVWEDSVDLVKSMLSLALQGKEERNVEIKLKTFGPLERNSPVILVSNACCIQDTNGNIVGVCFVGQDVTVQRTITDKYTRMQGDYVGVIQSPSALIPPIFMIDDQGRCSEWNTAMENISGLNKEDAVERILLGEVFTVTNNFGVRLRDHDTLTRLRVYLNEAISGQETDKVLFGFYRGDGKYVEALLSANKRTDPDGMVTGVLCFLHVANPELQYALMVQRMSEQAAADSLKKLAYVHREIRKPLDGIVCNQSLIDRSNLSGEQTQLLRTSELCREQLEKIVSDTDIESIEESYMELKTSEFSLSETLRAVMNQAVIPSRERGVQIILDSPAEQSSMNLFGDRLRLQQVLANFLVNALLFSSSGEGSSITLTVGSKKERLGTKMHIVHVEFRITHPAPGIPADLIHQMFQPPRGSSKEGLGLYICQKLVKLMNGTVQYLRDTERSSFIILVEFPLVNTLDT